MTKFNNPIVEEYRGRKIKMYNKVTLKVSVHQFKQFIDAKDDLGLTAIEAIKQKKALCNICNPPTFIKVNNL